MKIITKNTMHIPTVLLVDDQVSVAIVVKKILGEYCEILFASTLSKAHDLMAMTDIDLILLDIELQGETGWDFIEQLKERSEIDQLPPIMFVTSYSDREIEEKALELGAIDFISKPILPSTLRLRVLNLLRLKSLERQKIGYFSQLEDALEDASFSLSCWDINWMCMYFREQSHGAASHDSASHDSASHAPEMHLNDYFCEALATNIMDIAIVPGVYEFTFQDACNGEDMMLDIKVIRRTSIYFDDYIIVKVMRNEK